MLHIANDVLKKSQLHTKRRTGDPSAVAGASILASLSNTRSGINLSKPAPKTIFETPNIDDEIDGLEVDSATNTGTDSASEIGAIGQIAPFVSNLAPSITKTGKVNIFFKYLFKVVNVYDWVIKRYILQQPLESREWDSDSLPASTPGMSVRSALVKEEILAGIIDGHEVGVSFDEFPYYLRFYT